MPLNPPAPGVVAEIADDQLWCAETSRVDSSNSGYIPITQPIPLPDCLPSERYYSVPICAERVARIMHDRAVVVLSHIVSIGNVLIEIVSLIGFNVFPYYPDELIPIFSTLFMPEPRSVADFVDRSAKATTGPYRDYLPPAPHSNKGPTSILLFEGNEIREVVGIVHGSLHETPMGPLLPMVYRVQNELCLLG